VGNGTNELITDIADVVGTISVKNEVKRVRIQDITILKNGRFNLFSLGKGNKDYLMQRWQRKKALENCMNSTDWKMGIKFEYTGRDTPQRNGLAEVAFHTIAFCGRAMLNAANVLREFRFMLWREEFKTATLLNGMSMIKVDNKTDTQNVNWDGKIPKYLTQLRTWGEAGTVKLRTRSHTKLDDRGYTCMFVG
jgi:hypothetical protein